MDPNQVAPVSRLILAVMTNPRDAGAHYKLAIARIEGHYGIERSYFEAQKSLRIAIELGHRMAPAALAHLLSSGMYGEPPNWENLRESFRLYKISADFWHAESQFSVGRMYEKGKGVSKDLSAASHFYWLASTQKHEGAIKMLRRIENKGIHSSRDWLDAFQRCKRAAEGGSIHAELQLYRLYEQAVTQENSEMYCICERMIGLGMYDEALEKINHENDGHKVYEEAHGYLLLAAELGDFKAQFKIGRLYQAGWIVDQDYDIAEKWFKLAAEQSHIQAQIYLAKMYENGKQVPKDYEAAARWYRAAAEQGDSQAQFDIGRMYLGGQGVENDLTVGVRWYQKAADQGDAHAQFGLGRLYEEGQGVTKDILAASRFYLSAAIQGDPRAQFHAGRMYENGFGVGRNVAVAEEWYKLSAEQYESQKRKTRIEIEGWPT